VPNPHEPQLQSASAPVPARRLSAWSSCCKRRFFASHTRHN